MYTIGQIEDAICERLAVMCGVYSPLSGDDAVGEPTIWHAIRTIKSYQGELDDEESIARAIRLFPAILVMYAGSEYDDHGSRQVERMTYVCFVCDKSLRLEEEARQGGTQNPGAYAMLNGIRDILTNSRLGLDIFPLSPRRELPVWFGKGISIYSAEYETAQALLYVGD